MSDELRDTTASTYGSDVPSETADTAEIREGIEQTRNDMSETIEAIQARLNPDHLKDQVKEQVREQFHEVKATVRDATIGKAEEMARNVSNSVSDARYTITETISHNPIPAAMVALGLGWLWMNRRSGPSRSTMQYGNASQYRYGQQPSYEGVGYYNTQSTYSSNQPMYGSEQREYGHTGVLQQGQQAVGNAAYRVQETAGNVAEKAQETVGNTVQRVQETAGNIADRAQETASDIAYRAQYQAQRLEDRFQQTLRSNPLAVGAVALALGTAVGFALPETEREHQLMGEARDNLVDKVQTAVQETVEKVQQVAGDVMEEAKSTAQTAAQEQGLTKS